ncbi:unnamed protein product [Dovyalis caffra]|uniref:Uncharacterized protein n=1 Tax=Dovyalis caffra TaxID=77055 RepID=A0AAV1SHW9_9ROSI|nr:unnamed protein product [Dovyalis caffra]
MQRRSGCLRSLLIRKIDKGENNIGDSNPFNILTEASFGESNHEVGSSELLRVVEAFNESSIMYQVAKSIENSSADDAQLGVSAIKAPSLKVATRGTRQASKGVPILVQNVKQKQKRKGSKRKGVDDSTPVVIEDIVPGFIPPDD